METRWLHPVITGVAVVLSLVVLKRKYQSSNLQESDKVAIGLATFFGAMIGSRFPFLLGVESANTVIWFADGKTILGGIFGGYVAVEITKILCGIRERTGDYFAVPVAIAVAGGRLACFFGGCCFGVVSDLPWCFSFPASGDDLLRHPTQLYEASFHFIWIGILLMLEAKSWLKEKRLAVYLGSYLVFRFLTEMIRPEPQMFGGLTSYQIACLLLIIFLVAVEFYWSQFAPPRLRPQESDGI